MLIRPKLNFLIIKPIINLKGTKLSLKRTLTFWQATMFGIGLILGAGIYVVIGRTATYAESSIWLSVLVAGFIAFLTGLSYAELSGMYPRASSSYYYVKRAIPYRGIIAFLVGWMIFFEAASGAATAAVGFAYYFTELLPHLRFMGRIAIVILALLLIVLMSLVNWWGIKESSSLNVAFTLIELSGLILVIFIGFIYGTLSPNYFSLPSKGFLGILQGSALIFFAYVGFELMATTSEETLKASVVMPRAILAALFACSTVYLLVSLTIVKLLTWKELTLSEAPLALAVERAIGSWGWYVLAFIALFATTNTVLGFLVSSSRMAYGMAVDRMLHFKFSEVHHKRGTPHYAVMLAGLVATFEIIVAGLTNVKIIDIVAKSSNLGCLIAFIFVNLSVIILRFKEKDRRRPFRIPGELFGIPILSFIGSIMCLIVIILTFHEPVVWFITLVVLILGAIFKKFSQT